MSPTLDSEIAIALNHIARHASAFNEFQRLISDNNLLKCGVFMGAIWWLWFRKESQAEDAAHNRQIIVGILIGCLVAMFITRILTHTLPHRTRPLYEAALHLQVLFAKPGVDTTSSLPSDHAALFCALAAGFFFISKRLGAAAMLYAIFFVCFPRAYLGYHYVSDLFVGGLIGVTVACLANMPIVRERVYQPIVQLQQQQPSLFYAVFFLLTYQIDDLFNNVRNLLAYALGIGV